MRIAVIIIIVYLYTTIAFSCYEAWLVINDLTLLDLSHELFFHFVEKTHYMVKIWLYLLFEVLWNALIWVIIAIWLPLRSFSELVTFIESMYIFKRLAQRSRHLLVQVLMMSLMLPHSVIYELLCASLLNIVIKPRQVELIHAEADKVEKGLDVVDRGRIRV